ncbi:hypothetical protein BN1708_016943, partial [Verticillium longisporum]
MIPGPIEFDDAVLQSMSHYSESHVGPGFVATFGETLTMLRKLFQTTDPASQPYVISGSGTLGWDIVAANLVEPGEDVLVLTTGYFSDGFADCFKAYGGNVTQLRAPVGERPQLPEIEKALKEKKYKMITVTHVDTSTGVLSELKDLSALVRKVSPETLLVVDGVCSVACEEIQFDGWKLDGVQDMACDTFIKIARQCRRHFVALQPSENEPFIEEIVRNMHKITCDLTPQQIHTFYEACGYMVAAQGNKHQQERLLSDLMAIPNAAWDEVIKTARANPTFLQDSETIKIIGNIMKTNVSACSSIGPYFYPQIGRIFHDMLQMYQATSQLISEAVQNQGEIATKMPNVRGLRTIKKEILKLIETYVEKAEDLNAVRQQMVPPLLESILTDYNRNVAGARDAEVLKAISAIITKLSSLMEDQVPNIMENVFECTLEMINKDFSEFPEHRVEFFNLLRAINLHCFPALLKLDNRQFKFVIDSCSWAFKHDNRDVEAAGLNMCLELINNIAETDVQTSNAFFQQFFITILQDVFFVLTDTDHKAGFKTQSMILMRMFYFV